MKHLLLIFILFVPFNISLAWHGYDNEQRIYIEIDQEHLVKEGEHIEVYDYSNGIYRDVEVKSVDSDKVEVYDYETGEYRTFEME